ncbi:hypothetical protein FOMPIDRAFT_1048854 [Fomitopsis schrenkii]|uniref:Uncharacterized protein n=1 Tax=Fomitopsis schrenkii TaxID=2126942 RepID=S8FJ11_FOMSC|nr:hypothetical protein FOMPIDRAFT_1048854 [Fomitopsis schrenkii]
MDVAPKKGTLKLGRALKTAARLPARVSGGRGSAWNTFSPLAGELPVVFLCVQVCNCRDLVAQNQSGLSDPLRPYHQRLALVSSALLPPPLSQPDILSYATSTARHGQ